MKKKLTLVHLLLVLIKLTSAQLPDTDIFLISVEDIINNKELIPENITNRKGYDNHPWFSDDGNKLYYVAADSSGQTDIFELDLVTNMRSTVAKTKESEFSPMPFDHAQLFTVRIDLDTAQRAYRYNLISKDFTFIKGTNDIGYANIINDSLIAAFILGEKMTLQLINIVNGERKLIASDVGRCIRFEPKSKKIFFVIKQNADEWSIFSYHLDNQILKKVVPALSNSEDFEILNDSTLLMGFQGKIFSVNTNETNNGWRIIADLSNALGDFYRLVLDKQKTKLALVGYTGIKP